MIKQYQIGYDFRAYGRLERAHSSEASRRSTQLNTSDGWKGGRNASHDRPLVVARQAILFYIRLADNTKNIVIGWKNQPPHEKETGSFDRRADKVSGHRYIGIRLRIRVVILIHDVQEVSPALYETPTGNML